MWDNDEASDFVVVGHEALANIGTAIATFYGGEAAGGLVATVSSAVQAAIENGEEADFIGTVSVAVARTDVAGNIFGMAPGHHSRQFEVAEGEARIKFTVLRIAQPAAYSDWLYSVTLNRIHVNDDSDDGFQ